MTNIKRTIRTIAQGALVALALSACSGTDAPDATSTADDATADGAETEGQSDGTEATDQNTDDGSSRFSFVYSIDTTSMDPDLITSANSQAFLYPVYDQLVYIDPEMELKPMLASEWSVNEDGTAMTMELIEDWSFHDGTPFNAEAVKANIERSMTLEGSTSAGNLTMIEDVIVTGDYSLEFQLNGGGGPLPAILGGPAGMMISPEVFDAPDLDIDPQGGSGAFELAEYSPDERVVYRAVDDYWDPEQQNVDEFEIRVLSEDSARMNAVLEGGYTATFLRPTQVGQARDENLNIDDSPVMATYDFYMNTARSEFDKKEVRQAINHAIDRSLISSTVLDDLCSPTVQLFPEFHWAHNPDLGLDYYEYDPERARELLAEAGLPEGFSFDATVLNLPVYLPIAEILQAMFGDVGIEMNVQPLDPAQATEAFAIEETVDAMVAFEQGQPDPSMATERLFLEDSFANPGGHTAEGIAQLQQDATASTDPAERAPVYQEMMEIALEEAYPTAFICHPATPLAFTDEAEGVRNYAHGVRNFRGVGVTN